LPFFLGLKLIGDQMVGSVSAILALIAGLVSIPVAVFFTEILASLLPKREAPLASSDLGTSRPVAVVVPAHDESSGILPTIHDILPQLAEGDRLVVVADNCTDDTAAVASATGAEVIVRNDRNKTGKGYAMAWAIDYLKKDPPAFVVFTDADCRIQPDMIEGLRNTCSSLNRPIQARYLMQTAAKSPVDHSFAEFAWAIRNWARPLGLRNLGCPTQLMGTGMVFPWKVISTAPLASGHQVEDLKLGLDLAAAGSAPYFFPSLVCTSEFPTSAKGADSQRQRWVGGHLGLIARMFPRYLILAITRLNFDLLVLAFDLAVPPLSLLGIVVVGMFLAASLAWLAGFPATALMIATANLLVFILTVLVAWWKFGRDLLPARGLLSIGSLVVKKLKFYRHLLLGGAPSDWIRTDRAKVLTQPSLDATQVLTLSAAVPEPKVIPERSSS
jgi:glycosyltransferase involved in cell wall biosynthesis